MTIAGSVSGCRTSLTGLGVLMGVSLVPSCLQGRALMSSARGKGTDLDLGTFKLY